MVSKNTITALPHLPGVYLYKDNNGSVIYVGKAKDLKKRISQYFQKDHGADTKTANLVDSINEVKTIVTGSEFDALLLESKLIRQFLPKYNIASRDDKSPLYIAITTNEPLPQVLWLRKSAISLYPTSQLFGPFQSPQVARSLLRQIRHIIPYCISKTRNGNPCFYTHLGLCEPCPSIIERMPTSVARTALVKKYRTHIRQIIAMLSGKSLTLLHTLERNMAKEAAREHFEEAHTIKRQVDGIKGLLQRFVDPHVYVQNELYSQNARSEEANSLRTALLPFYPNIPSIHRIECIDISNTGGSYTTGSLVVLVDGIANTSDYRRFKIRAKDAPNDVQMIAEVVTRRFHHPEWPTPDLFVVDGGKGQVAAAATILNEVEGSPPLIGLAKRFEEIIIPKEENGWNTLRLPVDHPGLHILERIRDESHRFARAYHRLLRRRAFLPRV